MARDSTVSTNSGSMTPLPYGSACRGGQDAMQRGDGVAQEGGVSLAGHESGVRGRQVMGARLPSLTVDKKVNSTGRKKYGIT